MSHPTPRPLARLARIVRGLCIAGGVALVASPFWFLFDPLGYIAFHGLPSEALALDRRALLFGTLVSVADSAISAAPLWQLWKLFDLYARGRVFDREAVVRLRRFAWTLLAMALLQPVIDTAMILALTLGNPPGHRLLSFSIGTQQFVAPLMAAVVTAIATVMAEAVRLSEENEQFV
jgi:hypothetical protein